MKQVNLIKIFQESSIIHHKKSVILDVDLATLINVDIHDITVAVLGLSKDIRDDFVVPFSENEYQELNRDFGDHRPSGLVDIAVFLILGNFKTDQAIELSVGLTTYIVDSFNERGMDVWKLLE